MLTTADFVAKASSVHGDRYDYANTVYAGSHHKLSFRCRVCDTKVSQVAKSHLKGHGCAVCGRRRGDKQRSLSTAQFVAAARRVHGDCYGYDCVSYTSSWTKVDIWCRKCQRSFQQAPANHLADAGCPTCGYREVSAALRTTRDIFLRAARRRHGDKYDYSAVPATLPRSKSTVPIGCKACGQVFHSIVGNHVRGSGCPACGLRRSKRRISKAETAWLDHLRVPQRQVLIRGTNLIADGYDPITQTVYEFLGDFYHGNPACYSAEAWNPVCKRTFGELHRSTMARFQLLHQFGFEVVYTWERDWRARFSKEGSRTARRLST